MLELNYKHAAAQYNAAAFLLKRSLLRRVKRKAWETITQFALLNHLQVGSDHVLRLDST